MKRFRTTENIGKIKYLVSYHDGQKKHNDGSDFFDIAIFKNKRSLNQFVNSLLNQSYTKI